MTQRKRFKVPDEFWNLLSKLADHAKIRRITMDPLNDISFSRDEARRLLAHLKTLLHTTPAPADRQDVEALMDYIRRCLEQPELEEVEDVPRWAIFWLEDGEDPDLTEEETDEIKEWMEDNHYAGMRSCNLEEYSFCDFPQFGKACEVVTCVFEKKNETNDASEDP